MPATYPFDPADDFLIFDGLESITYLSRLVGEVFGAVVNVDALQHRPDGVEPELSGEIPVIYHIARKQLNGIDAKPRDELIDSDDVRFVVVDVKLQSFSSRYILHCKKSRGADIQVFPALGDDGELVLTDDSGNILVWNSGL